MSAIKRDKNQIKKTEPSLKERHKQRRNRKKERVYEVSVETGKKWLEKMWIGRRLKWWIRHFQTVHE